MNLPHSLAHFGVEFAPSLSEKSLQIKVRYHTTGFDIRNAFGYQRTQFGNFLGDCSEIMRATAAFTAAGGDAYNPVFTCSSTNSAKSGESSMVITAPLLPIIDCASENPNYKPSLSIKIRPWPFCSSAE